MYINDLDHRSTAHQIFFSKGNSSNVLGGYMGMASFKCALTKVGLIKWKRNKGDFAHVVGFATQEAEGYAAGKIDPGRNKTINGKP